MAEKHPRDMTIEELIADVATLPNTERTLLSHNERVLIELCQALGAKLEATQPAEARDPWTDHDLHSIEDWRQEVANGDTRRGYWSWVEAQLEQEADESLTE